MTKLNDDLKRMFLELLGELLDEALSERQARAKEVVHAEPELPVMPAAPRPDLPERPQSGTTERISVPVSDAPPVVVQRPQVEPPPPQFSRPVTDPSLTVSRESDSSVRPTTTAVEVEPVSAVSSPPAPPFLLPDQGRDTVSPRPVLRVPPIPPPPDVDYVREEEDGRRGQHDQDTDTLRDAGDRSERALRQTMQTVARTLDRFSQDLLETQRRVADLENKYERDAAAL